MARTLRYYQAANAAQGISAGTGVTGATPNDALAFSVSSVVSSLNSGYDVFLNRGGLAAPASPTSVAEWFLVTSNPANLGRVFMWDGPGSAGKDPFTFDAGRYDPPSLAGDAGGWTNIGAGRWTKDFAFDAQPTLMAIYAQAKLGQLIAVERLELRPRSSQANCTASGDYYLAAYAAGVVSVTICTGSDTPVDGSPSRVFGGLSLVGRGGGRWNSAVWFNDAKRLEWNDPIIVMHGAIRMRSSNGTALCSDLLMVEPQSRYFPANNLLVDPSAATSDAAGVRRVRLVRPVLRSDTRSEASGIDLADLNQSGWSHQIRVYGQSGEVSIVDPELQGGRHIIIEIQGDTNLTNGNVDGWPRNVEVYGTYPGRAKASMPGDSTGYYRFAGCATYGGWRVENFEVTGQTTVSQTAGRGRFVGNYMHGFGRNLAVNSPVDDNGGSDSCISVANNGSGNLLVTPVDVTVARNLIVSPWNYPVIVGFSTSNPMAAGAVKIFDNTIDDRAHFNERKRLFQAVYGQTADSLLPAASGSLCCRSNTFGAPGVLTAQSWRNNLVIAPGDNILADLTGANGLNGAGVNVPDSVNGVFVEGMYTASGQQRYADLAAAGLNSRYIPTPGSAAIGASDNSSPRLDSTQRVRPIPASVGAFEPA